MNLTIIVLAGLLIILIVQNILLSRRIVKRNKEYEQMVLDYGMPLIEAALGIKDKMRFESYTANYGKPISQEAFAAFMDKKRIVKILGDPTLGPNMNGDQFPDLTKMTLHGSRIYDEPALTPGRCSGSMSIGKLKHNGPSYLKDLMEKSDKQRIFDIVSRLKDKFEATGIKPEVLLVAPDVEQAILKERGWNMIPYDAQGEITLHGLRFVVLRGLPEGSLYVLKEKDALIMIENTLGAKRVISKPITEFMDPDKEKQIKCMNEVLQKQYDKEEDDDS